MHLTYEQETHGLLPKTIPIYVSKLNISTFLLINLQNVNVKKHGCLLDRAQAFYNICKQQYTTQQ
jgi:hypothetical protein